MTLEKEFQFRLIRSEDSFILVPKTEADKRKITKHVEKFKIPEDRVMKVFLPSNEQAEPDRKKYLDKLHKVIRIMAVQMGYTFQEYKDIVKKEVGIVSFADSFNDELSMVIEFLINRANNELNIDID